MPINPVALITGALSFSAALTWNKAINDSINSVANKQVSSITQAIITTVIIIFVVIIINIGISIYSKYTNKDLKKSVIRSGGDNNSKVKLWIDKYR